MMKHPLLGEVKQIAYLTDDIEATAATWMKMAGVAPWTLLKDVNLPAVYEGHEIEIKMDVALAYHGDIQIELIHPTCDTRSPYSDMKEAKLWGLHHLQFACEDMDNTLQAGKENGLDPICMMNASAGGRYAYLRGPGVWFELMESNGSLDAFFQHIKSSCQSWDGKTLIA